MDGHSGVGSIRDTTTTTIFYLYMLSIMDAIALYRSIADNQYQTSASNFSPRDINDEYGVYWPTAGSLRRLRINLICASIWLDYGSIFDGFRFQHLS